MASTQERLGEEIVARCRDLGFALAGVTRAAPSDWGAELRAWLEGGGHGSMAWMERRLETRLDVGVLLPGARSVVMVADQYGVRGDEPDRSVPRRGRVARYARGGDYHRVMKKRLHALADELRERHPGEGFRSFVDTAPVMEREHAERAGLGWIGKHTLLIHARRGSWLLIGGIATTLDAAAPPTQRRSEDHCGTCTRCIDACPTDAITPYRVDGSRCISYLTIERRESIDERFFTPIGDWVFGCDVCQEVCPHNSPPAGRLPVGSVHTAYEERRASFDVLEVLGWSDEDRREAFVRSALKRATLEMMKRNAIIVAGNAMETRPDRELLSRLVEIAEDVGETAMVRETARLVLRRLRVGRSARSSD